MWLVLSFQGSGQHPCCKLPDKDQLIQETIPYWLKISKCTIYSAVRCLSAINMIIRCNIADIPYRQVLIVRQCNFMTQSFSGCCTFTISNQCSQILTQR